MEDLRRRCNATLALQREFTGSRLERQILMRAFALLVPADGWEPIAVEPGKADANQPLVITVCNQGGFQS